MASWVDITDRLTTPIYVVQDGGCLEQFSWNGVSTTPTGPALSKVGDRWVMPGDGGLHEVCTDPLIGGGCFAHPINDPISGNYGKFCIPVGLRFDEPIPGVLGLRLRVQMTAAQTGWTNGIDLTHYLISRDFDSVDYWDPDTVARDPLGGVFSDANETYPITPQLPHVWPYDPGAICEEGICRSDVLSIVSTPADSTAEQLLQVDYVNDFGDSVPRTLKSVSSILTGQLCRSEAPVYRCGVYPGRPAMWVPLIQVWVLTDGGPAPANDFWTDFVGCKELPT